MIATYHNHTNWSDGVASLDEIVERAVELGVDELGISDHYVLHPSGLVPEWSMAPETVGAYAERVLSHRGNDDLAIRLGLEIDYFPGHENAIRGALAGIPFDYLIGSVHEVDGFGIDARAETWNELDEDEQNEKHRAYWRAERMLAESGLFTIVAHLDLSKKFGHRPTIDLRDEIARTLDAIAASGLVVELNTAGWHKPCRDGYPSLDILKQCRQRRIPVTLSSDAHDPDHLLRDFTRGRDRLREAGYTEIARFAGGEVTFESLDGCRCPAQQRRAAPG